MALIVESVFYRLENILEKKEKLLVNSIFSFSHNVWKSIFIMVGNTRGCLVKG